MTYCLTADIGVPNLGVKLHRGRLKRVVIRDLNVDREGASMVRRIGRPRNRAFEVLQVDSVDWRSVDSGVVSISLDVLKLFGHSTISAARHGGGNY